MSRRYLTRKRQSGFTLFEMLVVLVISGLIGAVLTQGFGLILTVRLSVANKIENLQEVVLNQNIAVDPLRGILPDYRTSPNPFRGQMRTLSGQTLRPLLSPPGAPTPFQMTLDYDSSSDFTLLIYEEPGRPKATVARWKGANATFKYRDLEGAWEPVWPPQASTSQTPWLIWIDIGPTEAPLIASVSGPHQRVTRLQDMPGGMGSLRSP
jgi:prepilin-type N-terminal cleavage/methylation domain-containing protein